jgi:hypothetical protein
MSFRERLIDVAARAGLALLRAMILHLPDKALGRMFRVVERLVYASTGDRELTGPVAEIADVFETGPPFTATLRKMFKDPEPEIAASAVKCLTRKSPYGAV